MRSQWPCDIVMQIKPREAINCIFHWYGFMGFFYLGHILTPESYRVNFTYAASPPIDYLTMYTIIWLVLAYVTSCEAALQSNHHVTSYLWIYRAYFCHAELIQLGIFLYPGIH